MESQPRQITWRQKTDVSEWPRKLSYYESFRSQTPALLPFQEISLPTLKRCLLSWDGQHKPWTRELISGPWRKETNQIFFFHCPIVFNNNNTSHLLSTSNSLPGIASSTWQGCCHVQLHISKSCGSWGSTEMMPSIALTQQVRTNLREMNEGWQIFSFLQSLEWKLIHHYFPSYISIHPSSNFL